MAKSIQPYIFIYILPKPLIIATPDSIMFLFDETQSVPCPSTREYTLMEKALAIILSALFPVWKPWRYLRIKLKKAMTNHRFNQRPNKSLMRFITVKESNLRQWFNRMNV